MIPANNIKGWHLYIDGVEKDLFIMNKLYMGTILDAGEHHIVLKYSRPFLFEACVISMVGILLYIIGLVISNRSVKNINYSG